MELQKGPLGKNLVEFKNYSVERRHYLHPGYLLYDKPAPVSLIPADDFGNADDGVNAVRELLIEGRLDEEITEAPTIAFTRGTQVRSIFFAFDDGAFSENARNFSLSHRNCSELSS